ncbi:hypothetical protein EMIHUDRAFT_231146, partial [Emiliania huxleyi CCMP1516]|uniref:CPL domain-containing protein n=2 Tax=Emiliania huxleyi TaxID=2903 RepID=A0A0D3K831_EMIH1
MRSKPAKPAGTAPSTFNRKARRDWTAKKRALSQNDNPENEPEALACPRRRHQTAPRGSKKRKESDAAGDGETGKSKPKKARPAPRTTDPAAELARANRQAAKQRPGRTDPTLLQRAPQACYRSGTDAQRDALMEGVQGAVALSHYGHFFLLAVLRHGSPRHKRAVVSQLAGRVPELVAHAEGSAVLQLAYASAATPSQRTSLYRELWGKDFALLGNRRRAQLALLSQSLTTDPESPGTGAEHDSLGALFAADPSVKPRVLRQMEATLSKAARKGLAVTSIVQRGFADLLEHSDTGQRAVLAGGMPTTHAPSTGGWFADRPAR